MAREREALQAFTLEEGRISFFYRPRLQERAGGHPQKILMVLEPDQGNTFRLIAIARQPPSDLRRPDRFWGFVDAVVDHPQDIDALLSAQTYDTRTLGTGHLPAASPAGSGVYSLMMVDGEAEICWSMDNLFDDPNAGALRIRNEATYVVKVANPDPAAWGLLQAPALQQELFGDLETHITLPNPPPPSLQNRFHGRYARLDSLEWLEHAGAELVFVSR